MADQSSGWIWDPTQRKYYRYVERDGKLTSVWQGDENSPSHSRNDSVYSQSSSGYTTAGTSSSPIHNIEVQHAETVPIPNDETVANRRPVNKDAYDDGSDTRNDYTGYASNPNCLSHHQYSTHRALPAFSQTANTQAAAAQDGTYQHTHHALTPQTYTTGTVAYTQNFHGMHNSTTYPSQYPTQQSSFTVQTPVPSQNDVHIYGVPSQEGAPLQGTWGQHSESKHYEDLDPSYFVQLKVFFAPGRMFAVLFTEPAGSTTTTPYNPCISVVKYGEKVYSQIRRFIVVRQKHEFCYACPVFTYQGRATLKYGVRPAEHAVVFTTGYSPILLDGENGITKDPIAVDSKDGRKLDDASRIYFGIHHPIQYNVKVKDLGMVCKSDIPKVIGYWREEHQ